jgi:hypothetical protein
MAPFQSFVHLKKFLFLVMVAILDTGWRMVLTDTILKETNPGTIPARFGLLF